MKKFLVYKWYIVAVCIIIAGLYYYFGVRSVVTEAVTFYAIDIVEKGTVSSGIRTTGQIVAEQKLDLDVYKQLSRIDTVSTANGEHVEKGAVLVSFDKSDVLVDTESSRVALSAAELALETETVNAGDPNTHVRTLENQITAYAKAVTNGEQDIKDAYQDFLNTSLDVEPGVDDVDRLKSQTEPTLSGRYVGVEKGEYRIDIYASGADSGYSFRVSGLETMTTSVYFGKAVDLGTRGLKITFPTTIKNGDQWMVKVPNTSIASYSETKRIYEEKVTDLRVSIQGNEVNLKNATQDLEDLIATDSSAYRNLNIEKAALAVSSEQQKLIRNYDVLKERSIVAPFAGTIQDMTNVVVGATPTGGTSDTINLGTLISDTFLTTFTLSAADVSKVVVGQKVKVTITSFARQPVFDAYISEISSLPATEGVAQYTVKAKLNYDRTKDRVVLREGVLADIEVVQQEKEDALRVPLSALTYTEGKPFVKVIDTLTDEQKEQVSTLGVVRVETGVTIGSYPVAVELGIQGSYYVEVTQGLTEGSYIQTSDTADTAKPVVEQSSMRPGSGQNHPPTEAK